MKALARDYRFKCKVLSGVFISCLFLYAGLVGGRADDIFDTDFSTGTFAALGWTVVGPWSIGVPVETDPNPASNGAVAKFAPTGDAVGTLTKKFEAIANPSALTLNFEGGYGWGTRDHSQALQVMLLNSDGNGYIFDIHRASATWGAQWTRVTNYGYNDPMTWSEASIDTTQLSVRDNGELRKFTITRDAQGNWTFNGEGWAGGPLTFTDTTVTTFSQVVLRGTPNTDELFFNKIKLTADKSK